MAVEKRKPLTPALTEWDYAPAPEAREIVTLEKRYGLFIGGELVAPKSKEWQPTISPATEEKLAEVAYAGEADVTRAVKAARAAYENGWSGLAPAERAKYLFRIARIIQERSRELAVLESLDGGKPIKESRDVDVPLAAAHFFYYAGWADKLEYAFPNRRPKPLGVAGQIIPWNFPLLMLAWKIAPALAAGNTVVLKPAETTPLTALLFADICRQAELPAGVVNIVTGDGRAGAALVKHDDVDKIAFTGSTEVGKAIQRELAGTDTRLTLELGGKAANIVFDDCALDQAVEGIVNGIYFNQGHVCCAGSRLLVQESIYEQTVAKLKRRLETLRLGDPLDKNTDIGAINSKLQLDRITELVQSGKDEGAEIFQPACRLPEKGYWFAPTVFTNVAQSYRIAQEEIFGPCSACSRSAPPRRRREGEQHRLRALRRRLDREGLADPLDGRAAARRRRLGEHVQPLRSRLPSATNLFRIARIIQERSRELAVLESLDGGKPIKESRDVDVPLAAAHFFYYAGWADKLEYAFPNRRPRPLGVAGQIIPWNFPLLMLAWKIAPALAAGNTVVLKPAETTPLSALLFADICRQAELPAGVVNIITGDGRAGAALVKQDDVDKIAFTGSTEVGKAIQRELAGTDTKLTLELGGKAANIVFDDCALDQAVEGIVNGIYFNQGHVCCAGSRLLVQESIYEQTVAKLKRRLETLRLGDPLDKNTDIGAINSKMQLDRITELVESGKDEGAEIFQPACRLPEKGYWFAPTVFTNVAQSYRIAQEEIFGPVLSVLTFRTPEEAVEKANNTAYGLSAGVWTEKGSRILWMAERLRAGVVWANTFNRFDPASPFGGYKESGFGREGGRHGLEPYLRFDA